MKFLCEQCKAKYQISDDKVAGKTVRMKCRKCGHMIEVRAEVTETSVSTNAPAADFADGGPSRQKSGQTPGATGPQPPRAAQKPGPPRAGSLATSLSRSGAPRPPAAARSDSLTGAFQKQFSSNANAPKRGKDDDDDISAALDMLEMSSEWYVAINGVPVGPVRVSELRRKAAIGAVTEDSLVWQEGLEEWRPVRSVTELAQLVREAATSGRPSLLPPEPRASTPPPPQMMQPTPGGATAVAPRPPLARAPSPPRAPGRPEPTPAPPVARNNVVPITSRLATAEKLDSPLPIDAARASRESLPQASASSLIAADPFAVPNLAPPAVTSPFASGVAPAFGPPPAQPPFGNTGSIAHVGPVSSLPPDATTKKAPPWIAIAMIVLAGAFGITAAIVIFRRTPAPPVVAQNPVSPPSAAPAPPPSPDAIPSAAPSDSVATAPSGAPDKPGAVASRGGGAGTPKPATTGGKIDLGDLLKGPGSGPASGPGGGGGGGGGSSSLSSSQIESIVHGHAAGVKRSCWERVGSQSNTVNVTCHVTIGGSGAVQSVSANGDDPTVAKCIETAVRSWSFPASGGSTNVDIPFHFVRQ